MSHRIDHLAHLRADSARFAAVLAATDPSTPVPTCEGWTAADLLWHLGQVQHFWGATVADRLADPGGYDEPARPDSFEALVEFFDAAHTRLSDALADTTDEISVWTWYEADQSVGFVRRRQAHEALIHRLDAELTAGTRTGLDATLATDGVLEALEWMFGGVPPWADARWDGAIGRLAATDTGTSWLVRMGRWNGTSPNSGTVYHDEPAMLLVDGGDPTFEITGAAADLDAWIWNRPPVDDVLSTGDTGAFEAIVRAGVQ